MRSLQIAFTVALSLVALVPPAVAGDVNLNGELGLFTLRSGYTYGRGQWGFSLYANEWDYRVASDVFWENFDPLWSNWDLTHQKFSAGFGFGITDRIDIDVALPYEHYHAFCIEGTMQCVGHLNGQTFVGRLHSEGLGDLRVGMRFGIVDNDRQGLSFNAFANGATGDDDKAVVTGEIGFGAGLGWSIGNWVLNGGYWDPGEPDFVSNVPISGPTVQEVSPQFQLGVGYAHPVSDRLDWITELSGAIMSDSDTGEYDTADVASGVRYRFGDDDRWAFNAALRLDLSHNFNGDPIGGLIGLTYATRAADVRAPSGAPARDRGPDAPPPPPAPPSAAPPPPAAAPPSPPPPSTYALTVRKAGTGGGTVTSNPAGIDCGSDCRESYAPGTAVRNTGTPDTCSTLEGFGGDCARDGSVTMSSDKSCVATFNRRPRPAQTFDACEKYGAWDCQTGLRETVPFATGTAAVNESALGTADGRGLLCDWANQLRACPELRLCVAGSTAPGEDACVANERAEVLVEFFRRQSGESAFSGIGSRVQAAPSCSPEDEKGSVGNLLLR
jgi:hypothetical protein